MGDQVHTLTHLRPPRVDDVPLALDVRLRFHPPGDRADHIDVALSLAIVVDANEQLGITALKSYARSLTNHEAAESLHGSTDRDATPPPRHANPPANMA